MILKNTVTGHIIHVKDIDEAIYHCSSTPHNFPAYLCTLDGIPCGIETSATNGIAVITPEKRLCYIMPNSRYKNHINLLNGRTSTGHNIERGSAVFHLIIDHRPLVRLEHIGIIGLGHCQVKSKLKWSDIRLVKSELKVTKDYWYEYPKWEIENHHHEQEQYETIQVPCLPKKYEKTHEIVGISFVTTLTDLILDITMDDVTVNAYWRHPHILGMLGIIAKLKFIDVNDIIKKNPILTQLPQVIKTRIILIKTKKTDEWLLAETTTLLTIPETQPIPEGYTITCDPESKIWSEVKR